MTTPAPSRVSHDVELQLVIPGETTLPVPAHLAYDTSDPYAVRATFLAGEDSVEWVFARDLLASGVDRPVGDGDVHVWPRSPEAVLISLTSPDGRAILAAPMVEVVNFVARTYELVAAGDEPRHLDVEAAITQLLSSS
jgi:Streptomyces sporulation and cell division protein, SsgA